MKPLRPATLPPESFTMEHWLGKGMTPDEAQYTIEHLRDDRIFINDLYQVNVRQAGVGPGWPAMLWLSIKRRDKAPCHDWRDLQEIKNQIVGPEHEGVELYPAESRLTDSANQYHLWVIADPEVRLPFGFDTRFVTGAADARKFGARQRKMNGSKKQ